MTPRPVILVIMGVSGSGKTTLGEALAGRLGWPFKEGDDLHPPANVARMAAGVALTDADRAPWLAAVAHWIEDWRDAGTSGLITCSALKRAYRETLSQGRPEVLFVYLHGEPGLLAARVARRKGHFMPPALLASQLADLEPPAPDEPAIAVDIDQPIAAQVETVIQALAADTPRLART